MGQLLETANLEEARQILNDAYSNMRIDAIGEGHWMRLASATLGPVRFDRADFRMAFHADASPLRNYVFGQVVSGRVRYGSAGAERDWLPGDVFLAVQPVHEFTADVEDLDVALAVIDQCVVDQVAQPAPGHPASVGITGYQPVSARAARGWASTCALLRDEVLPTFAGDRLVASTAARLFAAVTLATFPNTALIDPTIADRHDAHPQTLRRAIAFIEANAAEDISTADVARTARVTIRAVQLAFRRHLDTTPMRYLRRVRLDRARSELASAAPNDTVTAIATRWGYARPSVFAAHYRAAYGQSPSHTLRNR